MTESMDTVPTEAWDVSHPDHEHYYELTGRCFAFPDTCWHSEDDELND